MSLIRSSYGILNRLSLRWLLICTATSLVIFNEFGCFALSTWLWPRSSASLRTNKDLRILFVADPQLVGLRDEHPLLGYVTRWDSDKYLRLGFWHAVGHVRPDVVVFLGDLLDEGSSGSDEDYLTYTERFQSVFQLPSHVKSVFISGDNDVGGEGMDPKQPWKVNRFKSHFENFSASDLLTVNFIDFFKLSLDYGEAVSQPIVEKWKTLSHQSSSKYRVVCNHMTLLNRYRTSHSDLLTILKPHVIFTAHTHLAKIYRCTSCKSATNDLNKNGYLSGDVIHLTDSSTLMIDLNDSSKLYEITIPTCSYRMGVPKMGYGFAVVGEDGLMTFAVLWLPSRYKILISYVVFIGAALLLAIAHEIRRRVTVSTSNNRRHYSY